MRKSSQKKPETDTNRKSRSTGRADDTSRNQTVDVTSRLTGGSDNEEEEDKKKSGQYSQNSFSENNAYLYSFQCFCTKCIVLVYHLVPSLIAVLRIHCTCTKFEALYLLLYVV